jgi:hypothetical protein
MDIYSLSNQLRKRKIDKKPEIDNIGDDISDVMMPDDKDTLIDLFKSTIYNFVDTIPLSTYIVQPYEEMRIDLIMKNMYELNEIEIKNYYENVDILLTINNIDNPLNIKSGQVLIYPPLGNLADYRILVETDITTQSRAAIAKIGVPDKTTKPDSSRKNYLEKGVALPPTVNRNPKEGAVIKNGKYIVGGL